jgi:hypothetical protein
MGATTTWRAARPRQAGACARPTAIFRGSNVDPEHRFQGGNPIFQEILP